MLKENLQKQLKEMGYEGNFDLSSLVEACGDGFKVLYLKTAEWRELKTIEIHKWQAGESVWWDMEEVNDEKPRGEGSTPEEAVAMLYISLQNNKSFAKTKEALEAVCEIVKKTNFENETP